MRSSHALEDARRPTPRSAAPRGGFPWPKEHGAYAQLALPLLSVGLGGAISIAGAAFALAAVSAFLAHEPLQILLGARGPREKRERRASARVYLALFVGVFGVSGILALVLASPAARLAALAPGALFALLLLLVARGREKTTAGELSASLAFASVTAPVALAGGASFDLAFGASAVWACVFVASTLAVRTVLSAARSTGRRFGSDKHVPHWVPLAFSFSALCGLPLLGLARFGGSWLLASAPLPAVLVVVALALRPPPVRQLRRVGWSLVGAQILSLTLVVLAFHLPGR